MPKALAAAGASSRFREAEGEIVLPDPDHEKIESLK